MSEVEASEVPDTAVAQAPADEVPCADLPLSARVEAVLLTNDRPVTEQKLVEMLGLRPGAKAKDSAAAQVREAIDALNKAYESQGRAFRAERLAGGYQLLTTSAFAPLLARVRGLRQQGRLTPAALRAAGAPRAPNPPPPNTIPAPPYAGHESQRGVVHFQSRRSRRARPLSQMLSWCGGVECRSRSLREAGQRCWGRARPRHPRNR